MSQDAYGAIVTAKVNGEVHTTVGYGRVRIALETAIEELERRGPIEEILAISTPETIRRDLKASRLQRPSRPNPALMLPEPNLLAQIGRTDLSTEPRESESRKKWMARLRLEEGLLERTGLRHIAWTAPIRRIRIRPPRRRCAGETEHHVPCKLRALPGSHYCKFHRRRRQ